MKLDIKSQSHSTLTNIGFSQYGNGHQVSEKMLKFRRRHLPSRTQNIKRKYSDKLLLRILREHEVGWHQLEHVVRKWEMCQTKYTRMVPNELGTGFVSKEYKLNCKLPFCQRCNSWMKKKQAKLMVERFFKLIGSEPIDITKFSVVTINGPILPLGSDFKSKKYQMANQLRYRIGKLNGAVMQGEFEIAKHNKSINDPYNGKLHLHGVLYHPNQTRHEVFREFKKAFPKKRAVHVKCTYTERDGLSGNLAEIQKSIETDLVTFASYTCDVDISVKDEQEQTGQVLCEHLVSICSIWSGGKRGLRFQPGLVSAYKEKNTKVPKPKRRLSSSKHKSLNNNIIEKEIYQLSDVLKEELVDEPKH